MDDLAEQIAAFPPTMALDTPPGAKVRFTGTNGYPGERMNALAVLTVGECYEVAIVDVGGFESSVQLVGKPGWFNTVMFENA